MMTKKQAAEYIEEISEKICIKHLGHGDDILTAEVKRGEIVVSDGGCDETYDGPLTRAAIKEYVQDWLEMLWAHRDLD